MLVSLLNFLSSSQTEAMTHSYFHQLDTGSRKEIVQDEKDEECLIDKLKKITNNLTKKLNEFYKNFKEVSEEGSRLIQRVIWDLMRDARSFFMAGNVRATSKYLMTVRKTAEIIGDKCLYKNTVKMADDFMLAGLQSIQKGIYEGADIEFLQEFYNELLRYIYPLTSKNSNIQKENGKTKKSLNSAHFNSKLPCIKSFEKLKRNVNSLIRYRRKCNGRNLFVYTFKVSQNVDMKLLHRLENEFASRIFMSSHIRVSEINHIIHHDDNDKFTLILLYGFYDN